MNCSRLYRFGGHFGGHLEKKKTLSSGPIFGDFFLHILGVQ